MYNMGAGSLQKMYVKDSLKNQGDGFIFKIKNLIDSGSVSGVKKILVDDEERPLEGVTIELGGKVRQVSQITWSTSVYVGYGATMTIYVPGTLEPGEHTVKMQVSVPELGMLTLPVTDTVA